jgi:hypothetical protein
MLTLAHFTKLVILRGRKKDHHDHNASRLKKAELTWKTLLPDFPTDPCPPLSLS